MATNYVAGDSRNINLTVGAGVVSGDAVQIGDVLGTALDDADSNDKAVVDVSPVATYKHSVRNVTAYTSGAESAWDAVSEGKTVYYDGSSTMPTGVKLSLSALDSTGGANKKFGKVVGGLDATTTAKTVTEVEILQDRT